MWSCASVSALSGLLEVFVAVSEGPPELFSTILLFVCWTRPGTRPKYIVESKTVCIHTVRASLDFSMRYEWGVYSKLLSTLGRNKQESEHNSKHKRAFLFKAESKGEEK